MRLLPTNRNARLRFALLLSLPTAALLAYLLWSPGQHLTDGRHDLATNGIWLSHAWLGDDGWFARQNRLDQTADYRDPAAINRLLFQLRQHHLVDLFPHLAPATSQGDLPPSDPAQVERFLDAATHERVLPWVGGVLDVHCRPDDPLWRETFVESVRQLLEQHPRLAGIHLNIEPWPTGHAGLLLLLDELDDMLPPSKMLSVAAYPPPTRWHPYPDVHWDRGYFSEVCRRADHVAVMMYDTSIRWKKPYIKLMTDWTTQILDAAGDTPVLLGLPAYEDENVAYHHPDVETLDHALRGIHAGLARYPTLPPNYRGIAIYSHWTIDPGEWATLTSDFNR